MSTGATANFEEAIKLEQTEMFERLFWVDYSVSPDSPKLKWPALLFDSYSCVLKQFEGEVPKLKLFDITLRQLSNPQCMDVPVAYLLGRRNFELLEMEKGIIPSFSEFSLHLPYAIGKEIQNFRSGNQELYLDFHRGIDKVTDIMSSAKDSGRSQQTPSTVWLKRAESNLKIMKDPPPSTSTNEPDQEIGNNPAGTSASHTLDASKRKDSAFGRDLDTGSKKSSTDLQASPPKETFALSKISAENTEELSSKTETAKEKGRISQEAQDTKISKTDPACEPKGREDAAANEEDSVVSPPSSPANGSFSNSGTPSGGATVVSEASVDWELDHPIQPTETWESVLGKFEYCGMVTLPSGEFIIPGGKGPSQNGVEGRDYYDEDGFRVMLREKYGWKGPLVDENSSPSSSPSTRLSEQHEVKTPKKRKTKSSTPQAVSVSKRSRRQRRAPTTQTKHQDDDFWNFKNIFKYLQKLNWKYENSRNILRDWCYVLPGCSQETGTYLVDFFYEECEVVDYAKNKYTKDQLLQIEKEALQEASEPMANIGKVRANTVSP